MAADPPSLTIDAQRLVISVLREMLDAERARSDRLRDAVVRAAEIYARDSGNAGEAIDILRDALR